VKVRARNINFFSSESEDHERLDLVVHRLNLPRSEVCRRALRIGLQKLEKLTLPGSTYSREKVKDESSVTG
jgi:hypothetical protein